MKSLVPLFDLVGIFDDTFFFLTLVVACFGIAGLMSKSFILGEFSAFVGFVTITMKTEYTFYMNLLYVLVTLIFILLSFQIYGMAFGNNSADGVSS